MSFIHETYYALIKFYMSRIGICSEQSKTLRVILPFTGIVMALTFSGPQLLRLYETWEDLDNVIIIITQLLSGIVVATAVFNSMLKGYKINIMVGKMEEHWEMLDSTSSVVVLDKYAKRGSLVVVLFSIFTNISVAIYLAIPTLPLILDFVDPLNETRPKNYIFEAEYGVDPDKYYYFILAYGYALTIVAINMFVAIEIIYILFVEHACALFEVVGFAGMIEGMYSGPFAVGIGTGVILMSVTSLQALMKIEHPEMLIRLVSFTIGQVIVLYCNTIPGQRLIDHSAKVHKFAYHLDWYDISVKAQKLLILILIRSARPCVLTAGKVYIISLESFGSVYDHVLKMTPRESKIVATIMKMFKNGFFKVIQTSASYFMIFAQLL